MKYASDPNGPRDSVFTCLTCKIAFYTIGLQRDHYRTDWHRYNLKRKVAELGPISAQEFNNKILEQQNRQQAQTLILYPCEACRKNFGSENAYTNHVQSKKHKENLNKKEKHSTQDYAETCTQDLKKNQAHQTRSTGNEFEQGRLGLQQSPSRNNRPFELEHCLFCRHKAKDLDTSIFHMTAEHDLFIPDLEHLVDLKGLLEYLASKVYVQNTCLSCSGNGRVFRNLDAVRDHMMDKGHTHITYDDILEFSKFYDPHWTRKYGLSFDKDNQSRLPEFSENSNQQPILSETGFELTLPSGSRIGHRSLRRYYKQTLKPEPEVLLTMDRLIDYYEHKDIRYNNKSGKHKLIGNRQNSHQIKVIDHSMTKYLHQMLSNQNDW